MMRISGELLSSARASMVAWTLGLLLAEMIASSNDEYSFARKKDAEMQYT